MTAPLWLEHLILTYGYWFVLVAVSLETMGVPFPGETTLLAAAIYAGTGKPLNIALVILFAAAGAIIGDNIGFTVGRYGGYPLVRRILRLLHVRESALDYTQRFFEKHGNKTVFLGRFISILRATVTFLAGVSQMRRRVFFVWNAAGGICWAALYGLLGFFLGRNLPLLRRVIDALGIGGVIVVALAVVGGLVFWFIHRRRQEAAALEQPEQPSEPESLPPERVDSEHDRRDPVNAD